MAGVKPYEDWQVRMCIVMEAQVSGDESSKISIYDAQRVTSKQRIEMYELALAASNDVDTLVRVNAGGWIHWWKPHVKVFPIVSPDLEIRRRCGPARRPHFHSTGILNRKNAFPAAVTSRTWTGPSTASLASNGPSCGSSFPKRCRSSTVTRMT